PRLAYVTLCCHLVGRMGARDGSGDDPTGRARTARRDALEAQAVRFETGFRHRILAMVGHGELDGLQAASLLNDLGYVERIDRNLRGLVLAEEPGSLRALRRLARAAAPAKEGHGASREVAENGNCSCSHP